MIKNKVINASIILLTFSKALIIAAVIGIVGTFIHLQIQPEYYEKNFNIVHNKKNYNSFYLLEKFDLDILIKDDINDAPHDIKYFKVSSISIISQYLLFAQLISILLLGFLYINEFQKILWSVKNKNIFNTKNEKSFRKIGKYLLISLIIESFIYLNINDESRFSLNVDVGLILLILLSYVFAEIFKEGNRLRSENELTI